MEIIIKLIYTFFWLIISGTLLTFVLFKFNFKKIRELDLDKKILMWFPLAGIFLLAVEYGFWIRAILFVVILVFACIEYFSIKEKEIKNVRSPVVIAYLPIFIVALAHLSLLRFLPDFPNTLIYIIIGTAVSDVGGFFLGNTIGYHKLPKAINNKKSWEGVAGQIIGALIGVSIVKFYIFGTGSLWLFIPIGVGSAVGDLFNSTVKRMLGIKKWSNNIPGHGGFLDRFCSLAGSSLLAFYFLLLL